MTTVKRLRAVKIIATLMGLVSTYFLWTTLTGAVSEAEHWKTMRQYAENYQKSLQTSTSAVGVPGAVSPAAA